MFTKVRQWLGSDTDLLDGLEGKPLEAMIKELRRRQHELEMTRPRLGFIGQAGAGKSSLINAIVGQPVARVGVVTTDHSQDGEVYRYRDVELVDLPGCGDVKHPFATYIQDLKLLEPERYDGFILVTANRLTENDAALFRDLHVKPQKPKPLFIVRTHFDSAIQTRSESDARMEIEAYFREHLELAPDERIYLISSPHPRLYDLPALIIKIVESLPQLKQIKLLEVVPAYTEELLQKKRKAVEKTVFVQSTLAAANGLNPIPGVNIALDIGLMVKMTTDVVSAFGLTREQLKSLSQVPGIGMTLDQITDISAHVLARLAKSGVIYFLTMSAKEATEVTTERAATGLIRYGARYAPLIGTLVSAGIGFTTAYVYGRHLLNECEDTARRILSAQARIALPIMATQINRAPGGITDSQS